MANEAKAAPQEEVRKNCPACKKALKRAKRYYRNGQYYCNKNCWITSQDKTGGEAETAPKGK
ncbi:MAG: hypothetical protein NT079_02995 [Candidatus Omnitrophica bacterium]|nr:hypothetical protein [Candidatus Omnitrophota bacterium]